MDKGSEQTFFQRPTKGYQEPENVLDITSHQGNASQNHNEIPPYTLHNSYHQKDKRDNKCW